jgi:hypothetical protein
VKDAADMTFLIDDLKTGLRAGWKPVIAAMTVVVLMVIALTGSWELLGWNIDSTPDPDGGMPAAIQTALAIGMISGTILYLFWCWFLSNWITAEFGLAATTRPAAFYRHVVLQQFLALLSALSASAVIGIVIAIVVFTISMRHATSWIVSGLSSLDNAAIMLASMLCIMVVCFYPVILMATYLFLRFSTGLAITAKTGAAVNISRAFALCAEYVPRGKAIRLAHLFALCVFGLPFLIMAAGLFLGLDWIAYVNLVEQTTNTITTSGSEKITTTGTKYSYSVASPIISWVQMISMPFVTGLFLIRFLRQMPTDIPVGSSKPSTN